MRRGWRSWALAILLAAGFLGSAITLFDRQFASGELYPQFSTMRTDRMGARLLYDSLRGLPGIAVERNFLPLDFLPRDGAALVLLGLNPARVKWDDEMLLQSAEKIAARGNRVILAMYADLDKRDSIREDLEGKQQPNARGAGRKPEPAAPPLESMWKVWLRFDPAKDAGHPLYFEKADGWRVLESEDGRQLAVERDWGTGSVVLMAESGLFTNESAAVMDRLADVCAALGPYRQIVFDEQHLGVAESGSIMRMARQFRLIGLAAGLGLWAALFIWRNASGFPPPAPARALDRFAGRTSHAGLLTLLKRHIPPAEVAAVCWREWLSTKQRQVTPETKAMAEAILAGAAGPLEATRALEALTGAKGEL